MTPINAREGVTREAAFDNMQRLLARRAERDGDAKKDEEVRGGIGAPPATASFEETAAARSFEAGKEAARRLKAKKEDEAEAAAEEVTDGGERKGDDVAKGAVAEDDAGGIDGEPEAEAELAETAAEPPTGTTETRAETPMSLGQAEAARRALASVAGPSDSAADSDDSGSSPAASAESVRRALNDGLALLRRARDAARDAGDSPAAMVDADDELAAAVTALRRASALADAAAAGESPPGESPAGESPGGSSSSSSPAAAAAAAGNLANALLARGRLQRRLANAAAREEARARRAGIRAGVEGASDFHAELAEEFLVLAGRSFRAALVAADGPGIEPATSPGATRALTGWGAALALRGRMVFEAGDPESSAEAAALALAASEKYRAALETPFATDPSSTFDGAQRAGTLMDWGDALRLAGEATRDAEGGGFVRYDATTEGDAGGFAGLEFFEQAANVFAEAARLDPDGCGAEASRLATACEDAMYVGDGDDVGRDGDDGGRDGGWARARGGDPSPSPFPPYEPWR